MCGLWSIVTTTKEYALLAEGVLHVASEFLHRVYKLELRWEGARSSGFVDC